VKRELTRVQEPSRYQWRLEQDLLVRRCRKLICKTVQRDFHTSLGHYGSRDLSRCSLLSRRLVASSRGAIVRDAASATRDCSHVCVLIPGSSALESDRLCKRYLARIPRCGFCLEIPKDERRITRSVISEHDDLILD